MEIYIFKQVAQWLCRWTVPRGGACGEGREYSIEVATVKRNDALDCTPRNLDLEAIAGSRQVLFRGEVPVLISR